MRILPVNSAEDLSVAQAVSSPEAVWYFKRKEEALGLTASVVRRVRTPEGAIKYQQPIGTIIFDKSTWNQHFDANGKLAGYSLVDKDNHFTASIQRNSNPSSELPHEYVYVAYNHKTGKILETGGVKYASTAKSNAVVAINKHIVEKTTPKATINTPKAPAVEPKKQAEPSEALEEAMAAYYEIKINTPKAPAVDAALAGLHTLKKNDETIADDAKQYLDFLKEDEDLGGSSFTHVLKDVETYAKAKQLLEKSLGTAKPEVKEVKSKKPDESHSSALSKALAKYDAVRHWGVPYYAAATALGVLKDDPTTTVNDAKQLLTILQEDKPDGDVEFTYVIKSAQEYIDSFELDVNELDEISDVGEIDTPSPVFVSNKQVKLGVIDKTAEKGSEAFHTPKKSLADGSMPSKGTPVITADGKRGTIIETLQTYSRVQFDDGSKKVINNSKLNALVKVGSSTDSKTDSKTETPHFAKPEEVWSHKDVYAEKNIIDVHELSTFGESSLLPKDHPNYWKNGPNSSLKINDDNFMNVNAWDDPVYAPNSKLPLSFGVFQKGGKVEVDDDYNDIHGFYIVKEKKKLSVVSKDGKDIEISVVTVVDEKSGAEYNVRLKDVKSHAAPAGLKTDKVEDKIEETPSGQVTTMSQLVDTLSKEELSLFEQNALLIKEKKNQSLFPKMSKTVFDVEWPTQTEQSMRSSSLSLSNKETKEKLIQRVMQDNPGMTKQEVEDALQSIRDYSSSLYHPVNSELRAGGSLSEKVSKAVNNMDLIMNSSKTDKDMTVYRLSKIDPENFIPGDILEDRGFISTTILKSSEQFHSVAGIDSKYGTTLEILVPEGTNGVYLGSFSYVHIEKEFLLARGYRFKVLYNNNKHVILQLIPKDTI